MSAWPRRTLFALAGLSWFFVAFMVWRVLSYTRVPNTVVVLFAVALGVAIVLSGAAIAVAAITEASKIWRAGYRAGRSDTNGPTRLRAVKPDEREG